MTNFTEQARALGRAVRESETAINRADAQAAFDADAAAVAAYDEYNQHCNNDNAKQGDYQQWLMRMADLEIAMKSHQSVRELIRAQEEYAALESDVVAALNEGLGIKTQTQSCCGCGRR